MITELKNVTCKQMCEHIVMANFLFYKNGDKPTAYQIYKYSITGELSNLFFWYRQAIAILGYETSHNTE